MMISTAFTDWLGNMALDYREPGELLGSKPKTVYALDTGRKTPATMDVAADNSCCGRPSARAVGQ